MHSIPPLAVNSSNKTAPIHSVRKVHARTHTLTRRAHTRTHASTHTWHTHARTHALTSKALHSQSAKVHAPTYAPKNIHMRTDASALWCFWVMTQIWMWVFLMNWAVGRDTQSIYTRALMLLHSAVLGSWLGSGCRCSWWTGLWAVTHKAYTRALMLLHSAVLGSWLGSGCWCSWWTGLWTVAPLLIPIHFLWSQPQFVTGVWVGQFCSTCSGP